MARVTHVRVLVGGWTFAVGWFNGTLAVNDAFFKSGSHAMVVPKHDFVRMSAEL